MNRREFLATACAAIGTGVLHASAPTSKRIKLAISSYSYWHFRGAKMPIETVIEKASSLDVSGIDIRVSVYCGLKKWELMQTVAARLVSMDPVNPQWSVSLAHAVRHAQSIEVAKLILLEAVEQIPKDAVLHYNLACYECLLGNR